MHFQEDSFLITLVIYLGNRTRHYIELPFVGNIKKYTIMRKKLSHCTTYITVQNNINTLYIQLHF